VQDQKEQDEQWLVFHEPVVG